MSGITQLSQESFDSDGNKALRTTMAAVGEAVLGKADSYGSVLFACSRSSAHRRFTWYG